MTAFGWTWGLWGVSAAVGLQATRLTTVLFILSGFGPSLAAAIVVLTSQGRARLRRWLARCLRWRLSPGWYLAAFFGSALAIVAALGIDLALGGTMSPSPAAGRIGPTLLQFGLILFIGGPVGEEFGWRGYALPVLTAPLGWRWASLIVGAVWGLWHLPLFFIPGMAQANMPMALFMASSVALSVIFARLSVNTRFSVLPAIVLHWSVNAGSWAIPVTPQGGGMLPYYLVMGLLFAVAVAVFLKPGPEQ